MSPRSRSSSIRGNNAPAKFEELPRFPAITRDVAMEVPADLPHQQVATFFAGQKEPLLVKAEVFDVFADAHRHEARAGSPSPSPGR